MAADETRPAEMAEPLDTIVIGGGLAGLTAAALLAKADRRTAVVEQARQLGGRARTTERDSVLLNLGAHALYCEGHAWRILKSLGVQFKGAYPNPGNAAIFDNGTPYRLPRGLRAILSTSWLSLADKWRTLRTLMSLEKLDLTPLHRMSLATWVERQVGTGHAAQLLHVLFSLTSYANEPAYTSAGAAVEQLRLALRGNVWYLDGGWQTLIDGLRAVVDAGRGNILPSERAVRITAEADGVLVHTSSGTRLAARTAILAVSPEEAQRLLALDSDQLAANRWDRCRAIRAACLDVALRHLPVPDRRLAFRAGEPLYFSVHSAAARLAAPGVSVIHVMKYLGEEPSSPLIEQQLEDFLSETQPGWQEHLMTKRYLGNMVVTHALPLAETGGLAGRPGVSITGFPRLFVAGDWVGSCGMLADAAAASAEEAARAVLNLLASDQPITRRSFADAVC